MKREIKIWGERWLIRKDSIHAVSYLEIKPNHRCSWHVHRQKYNKFVVLSGRLVIKTEEGTIELARGESVVVSPGVKHEFRTSVFAAQVVEEMFVAYSENDIIRDNSGGPI